jgi:protein-disulfide isomerase
MNYKIFLSYFLILGFFLCLIMAYIKYNDATNEAEGSNLRQEIIEVLEKEVSNLQSQVDELKNAKALDGRSNINEDAIRDFIVNNPELIATKLEEYFHKKSLLDQNEAIKEGIDLLLKDFNAGLIKTYTGNINGKLKIIEFYDYSCKFCRQMIEINNKIISENPDVGIIFVEIPMLGPDSIESTRFSTAVSMFDNSKYSLFQVALFNSDVVKNRDNLIQIAINSGIDPVKLQKFIDENIDKIEERIKQNGILFNKMKLQGTPTYIVGNEIVVGVADFDKINGLIAKAREQLK